MAGGNWFSDRLKDIGDYIGDTWESDRLFGIPKDAPIRENILDPLASWVTAPPPGWTDTPTGQPSWSGFQYNLPEFIQETGAQFTSPTPPNVSDLYAGLEDKLRRPPMPTGITPIVVPPDGVPGVASTGIPSPPTIEGAAATAAAHQAPSLQDLLTAEGERQRGVLASRHDASQQYFDTVEATLETKLAELAKLQRQGVRGAADAVRDALETLEATRFARLRSDEADAKAYLATLEQARVAREDELSDGVKSRSDEALAKYDSIVSGVEGALGGLSGPPAQTIFGDASREGELLKAQQLSQLDLLDALSASYANDAVGRGQRLDATYDRAGMNLADSLWQQNTQNDLALQQALSDIEIASMQQNIDSYLEMAPMRFANEQQYADALAELEAGAAARGIGAAQQAQMLDLLGPLLGGVQGSPGFNIANQHGTEGLGQIFGAALQAGIGGTIVDKLMNPASSGQIEVPIGGQKYTVDEQWFAGKVLEMLSDASVPTRTVTLPDGESITLPVDSFAELQRSAEVAALG